MEIQKNNIDNIVCLFFCFTAHLKRSKYQYFIYFFSRSSFLRFTLRFVILCFTVPLPSSTFMALLLDFVQKKNPLLIGCKNAVKTSVRYSGRQLAGIEKSILGTFRFFPDFQSFSSSYSNDLCHWMLLF